MSDRREIPCMNSGCEARKKKDDSHYCSGMIVYDEQTKSYHAKLEGSTTDKGICHVVEILNNQSKIIGGKR